MLDLLEKLLHVEPGQRPAVGKVWQAWKKIKVRGSDFVRPKMDTGHSG